MTIVETTDSRERGMNPVAMTTINPGKEYWSSRESNLRPPVLKSEMLPTELWGSALSGLLKYLSQTHFSKNSPFSLNTLPNKPWFFTCLQYKSFENTVGKGEVACDEQFLFFPQCFLPFSRTFRHFHETGNCRLQTLSVWNRLKFVAWERVKRFQTK